MEFVHKTVLLNETIDALKVVPDGVYVDGTIGGGGHAERILNKLSTAGVLIGIDQDEEALAASNERLAAFHDRLHLVHGNFQGTGECLREYGYTGADGIILDLGVSSHQLDTTERGFSYMSDAPLDMRMDRSKGRTAFDVINDSPKEELIRIFREYGEERFAARIAECIVRAREKAPIRTTLELVERIEEGIPKRYQNGGHPAKRVFQAVRIEVNEELRVLSESLDEMIDLLNPGGRLCVITFHSLEDRIVKEAMRRNEHPCICPPDFPVCVCGRTSKGRVITRKPIIPSEEEIRSNRRAKSAKLRVFEHI